jgi:hypothetical protein
LSKVGTGIVQNSYSSGALKLETPELARILDSVVEP